MMNTEEFDKKYNDIQRGKKTAASTLKLFVIASTIIVIGVLIWSYGVNKAALANVIVTNQKGQILDTEVLNREKMVNTLIINHCETSVFFANTFDRLNIKENQAKALFYINTKDAKKVFQTYNNNGGYQDALKLGYIYSTQFEKMISINTDQQPYKVQFSSILSVNELDKVQRYRIISSGELITYTPQHPENRYGFIFQDYKQQYKRLEDE